VYAAYELLIVAGVGGGGGGSKTSRDKENQKGPVPVYDDSNATINTSNVQPQGKETVTTAVTTPPASDEVFLDLEPHNPTPLKPLQP
jgi:hypothetical protein